MIVYAATRMCIFHDLEKVEKLLNFESFGTYGFSYALWVKW